MANSNVLYTLLSILVLILVGFASSHPTDSHLHSTTRSVSDYADNKRWYHPRDHPVAALFIRDNSSAATVGSTRKFSVSCLREYANSHLISQNGPLCTPHLL
jgi:hypothetical protein